MLQLEPGTVFARDFKVVRSLAQGGMGAVYEVEQLSTSKPRALKLLHAQLAGDPKIRQRFEQEARVGARIESDHIVDVVAAGIEEPGTPWLVMEFLKGTDLGAHLDKRGPLPPSEVLEIFRQMGHALAAAHRAGLVHRDLKPENVFLAESRREGAPFTVKVLDFGIAKAIESAPGRATQAMGTPYWMAPEQCEDSSLIAPATDVWAMGLIAYSLLTGACYWRSAQKPDDASVAGLIMEMTTLPLDPPSVRAREYGRDHLLPPGFDAWFARCVARPVDQRFRDAAECVAALVPVLSQSLPAPSPPAAQTVAPAQSPAFAPPPAAAPAPSFPVTVAPAASFAAPWASAAVAAPAQRPPWLLVAGVVFVAAACVGAMLAWRFTSPRARLQDFERPAVQTQPVAPMPPPVGMQPAMTPIDPVAPPPAVPVAPPPRRPSGAARVELVNVTPIAGDGASAATAAIFERALRPHAPQVQACVRATQAEGDLGGLLVVIIDVAGGGAVTSTRLEEVDSDALAACVDRALKRTAFPRGAAGSYKATYLVR